MFWQNIYMDEEKKRVFHRGFQNYIIYDEVNVFTIHENTCIRIQGFEANSSSSASMIHHKFTSFFGVIKSLGYSQWRNYGRGGPWGNLFRGPCNNVFFFKDTETEFFFINQRVVISVETTTRCLKKSNADLFGFLACSIC